MTDIILFWLTHNQKPVFTEKDWQMYFETEEREKENKTKRIRYFAEVATSGLLQRLYKRK